MKTIINKKFFPTVGLMLLTALGACAGGGGEIEKKDIVSFNKAQTLFKNRKLESVEPVIKPLIDAHPHWIEAQGLLVKTYIYSKKLGKAEQLLVTGLEKNPNNPYLRMWLGRTLFLQESRKVEAAEQFKLILKADPENYQAHFMLGKCLEEQKKVKDAILQYNRSMAIEYQLVKANLQLAELYTTLNLDNRINKHMRNIEGLPLNDKDVQRLNRLKLRQGKQELAKK